MKDMTPIDSTEEYIGVGVGGGAELTSILKEHCPRKFDTWISEVSDGFAK